MIYAIDVQYVKVFHFFNPVPELHPSEFALGYILFSPAPYQKGQLWSLDTGGCDSREIVFSSVTPRQNI